MKDISLFNDLELKVRELVSSLEREKAKSAESAKAFKESRKLSQIEEKINGLISLIDQLENN
jgi:hypothetical protein|tara:strand:- start:4445 stop:4630 length:186 start_codon:yes stop_codon:yes gene_type:complete